MVAHFRIPLNLPHACTIAGRIGRLLATRLSPEKEEHQRIWEVAEGLFRILAPSGESGENPPAEEARRVCLDAATAGRSLVDEIERSGLGGDRLGQCVRNLFECLELGEEGATLSLRAGEDPRSIQRPV